jgi:hypothetical protein
MGQGWCGQAALEKEEKGGGLEPILKGGSGNRGRRGPRSVFAWRREKEGEGGLARRRAAQDGPHRPKASARGRRCMSRRQGRLGGGADRWAWGQSNRWRGQNYLNRFKIQTV